FRPRKSGLEMCWRDRSPDSRRAATGLHLPTQMGSGLSQTSTSLTVAGQWRTFTALPMHPISEIRVSRLCVLYLKLHSSLRTDPLLKGVLDLLHLCHEIRNLYDFRFGITARQNDMKHRWPSP